MFNRARWVNRISSGLNGISLTYCSGIFSEGLFVCTESIARKEILRAPVTRIAFESRGGMVQWEPDQSSRLGLALGPVRLSFEFPTSV